MEHAENNKIYIPELLCLLLRRWKLLLLAALVGALLLGGIRLVVDGIHLSDPEWLAKAREDNLHAQEKHQAEKTSLEQQIAALRSDIARQQTYLQGSVLMQLDPYDHSAGKLLVQIRTDYQIQPGLVYQDPDPTDSVVEAYAATVRSAELLQELAAKAGLSDVYMAELITVTKDLETNSMTVRLRYTDERVLGELLQRMTEKLESLPSQMEEAHTVQVRNMGISHAMDMELQAKQTQARGEIDTMLENLSKLKTRLDDLDTPDEKTATWTQAFLQFGLFALLGGVAAAVLFSLGYCLYAASCEMLLSCRMLREAGFSVLEGIADGEDKTQRLVYDLQNRCPQGLLVAGQLPAALEAALTQAVHTKDLLQDEKALKELTACTGVVLVVPYGSRLPWLRQQQVLVEEYGKQLIGCVFLDSRK